MKSCNSHILSNTPHQCFPWSLRSCLQRRGILLPRQRRKKKRFSPQCCSILHINLLCVKLPSDLRVITLGSVWPRHFYLRFGTHCVRALSLFSGMGRHVGKRWSGSRDCEFTRMWVRWSGVIVQGMMVWGLRVQQRRLHEWKVERVWDGSVQSGDDFECVTGQ